VGVALLDSSAVVAYLYADDALHHDAVTAIERTVVVGSTLAISAVTWTELLNGANVGHIDQSTLRGFIADLGIEILPVDVDVAEHAAALQAAYANTAGRRVRPKLRTPDALILGTGNAYDDIDAVICGDVKWSKVPGVDARIELLRERKAT
jgi:predicted nucleic acid-binding protein